METKQKIMLSKREVLLNKLETLFLENYKDFNLSRRESEIFWLLFIQDIKDSSIKLRNEEINDIILQKLGDSLTVSHLRNILNSLVKKRFLIAIIDKEIESQPGTVPYDHMLMKIPNEDINKITKEISKKGNKILKNLAPFHDYVRKMQKTTKRGKKPRVYYFEMDIIVKKIEQKQKKFINEMVTNKYGFTLQEFDINRLLHSGLGPEFLNLIEIKSTNINKFYKNILTREELQFLDKFGTKNTIQRLKSKNQLPEQKIRRLIKDLQKKNILSEIILTQENILQHDLSNLLINLNKNEKIYIKNTHKENIRSFLKEITEHHLKFIKILNDFIKIHQYFEESNKSDVKEKKNVFLSPINEIFEDLKTSVSSIEIIEKEFEKLRIYKKLFEKLDLGLLIFEDNYLKEFNKSSQTVFKVSDHDVHELSFIDFIHDENVIFLSENGVKEILIENFVKNPVLNYQWSGEVMVEDKLNNKRNLLLLNILQSIENKQVQVITIPWKTKYV